METTTELAILTNTPEPPDSFWNITTSTANETYNLTNSTLSINKAPIQDVSRFYPIMAAVMILSCFCLAFSIAVYAVLPEFKNVHGKNLISMSVCLLITYVMLTFDVLIRNLIPLPLCLLIAIVMHLNFLAYFYWTNVMAFDIWKSLTDMKTKGEVKDSSRKYLKYSVYAWTATLLTASPAVVIDLMDWVPLKYRPQFGVKRCWLSGVTAFINYFKLPMGVILLCNLCMFMLTLRNINAIKKMTAVLNVRQQQKRLNLYMKLFLLMGITWAFLFIPWITQTYYLYALAGVLTGSHGVFLFFIFVGKKKTLVHFYHALQSPRNKKKSSTASNTTSQQSLFTISNNRNYMLGKSNDFKYN